MALAPEDLAFLKEALPYWERLPENHRRMVENSAVTRFYPALSSLHNGSGDCSGLFAVKSGQLRAYILSEAGREITLFRLFERDLCIFSASCMMKNIRFDVHITAAADSTVILIPTAIYKELNQNCLAVSDYTNQLLSSRFSDVMWLLEQILFMSFDKRLALYLLEQTADAGGDVLSTTHEQIAQDMGTAREVVTRMLRYFQSEGMVHLARGLVTVTDRKRLEELAK